MRGKEPERRSDAPTSISIVQMETESAMKRIPGSFRWLLLSSGALAAMVSGAALAQTPPPAQKAGPSLEVAAITRRDTNIDASGLYQREVQACLSGRSHQGEETCLKEARNARAAERRGQLAAGGEDYTANALARCEPLLGEDRLACQARVMGFGGASGSVAGGGLLRWVETVVIPADQDQVRYLPQGSEPVVVLVTPRQ